MDSGEIASQFFSFNEGKHKCNYCEKCYVKNVTRMMEHTARCASAPFHVKNLALTAVKKLEGKRRKTETPASVNIGNQENINFTLETSTSNSSILTATEEVEKIGLWKMYLRALLSSGTPLSCIENSHWKLLFKSWKSHFPLPSEGDLIGGILQEEFESIKGKLEKKISTCFSYALQIDCNEKEVLLLLSMPETFLYKTYSKDRDYPGESLFNEVKTALSELGRNKCLAIIVNIDLTETEFWRLLCSFIEEEKLPIALYPSAVQTLNSLLNEVLNSPSYLTNKKHFDNIFRCLEKKKEIEGDLMSATKNVLGKESALKHPFYGNENTIDVINDLKRNFQYLVVTYETQFFTAEIANLILDSGFWQHSFSLFALIEPIKKGIQLLKNTEVPFSEIKHIEKQLKDNINSNLKKLDISDGERVFLESVIDRKLSELKTPMHYAANLLDPNYQGIDNSCDEYVEGVEYILKLGGTLKLMKKEEILVILSEYKLREKQFKYSFLWEINLKNPRLWWSSTCPVNKLSELACAISSLPHSILFRRKNSKVFDDDTLQKMKFVAFNMNAM